MSQLNDTAPIDTIIDTTIVPRSVLRTASDRVRRDEAESRRRESEPESMLALCLTGLVGWAVVGLLILLIV